MMSRQVFASIPTSKENDFVVSNVATSSAVENALHTKCSESEESSDDSYSSDGSTEEEEELEEVDLTVPITPMSSTSPSSAPRRPTSLSINSLSDRRASAPSQRSPLSISSTRSLSSYTCSTSPSPRTPSISMRHDAALRSFQQRQDQETQCDLRSIKQRPTKMDISSLPKVAAPRIQVVQVDDEGDVVESVGSPRSEEEVAKADRSAARKRMMSTLGRGQSKSAASTTQGKESRRVPSLDQLSTLFQSRTDLEAKTPTPKTPGTTAPFRHQRNVSCPTPTSPYSQQYGFVEVIITPPTPRLQSRNSPRIGVQLQGMPASRHGRTNSADEDLLAPPAFELAPGKKRAMEAQKANAISWLASWQNQQDQLNQLNQQMIMASMQHALPNCFDLMTMGMLNSMGMPAVNVGDSPSLIPGTPGAPSMIHIQQQKAILAQQKATMQRLSPKSTTKSGNNQAASNTASATSSWWRSPQSSPPAASNSSSPGSASSCSIYSKSSGAYSSDLSSPAENSPAWRRKQNEILSPEKVRSAGSLYIPPGKRAAMMMQS